MLYVRSWVLSLERDTCACITSNMYSIKLTFFFPEYASFLFRPLVFSRALGGGACRGPACTPRCKFGSRPGSVARALGVQVAKSGK